MDSIYTNCTVIESARDLGLCHCNEELQEKGDNASFAPEEFDQEVPRFCECQEGSATQTLALHK